MYDDVKNKIIISDKIQYFEPIFSIGTIKKLNEYFRESLVIELFWDGTIEFEVINSKSLQKEKISLLNLFKKYFSKRFRIMISILKAKFKN